MYKWVTKDNRRIPLRKIENDHLLNILRMLRRYAQFTLNQRISTYMACNVNLLPDGAYDCFMMEFDNLLEKTWEDFRIKDYDILLKEALRRNLKVDKNLVPEEFRGRLIPEPGEN